MAHDRIDFGRAWVSVPEAAALAGVTRQAVHWWIAQGRLTAVPTDDGYRIDRAELSRFLAERRAARAIGVKLDTLRQWADEAGA